MHRFTKEERQWLTREERTGRLVQKCYSFLKRRRRALNADEVTALCQLTWITRAEETYWLRTKLPALATIFRFDGYGVKSVAEMASLVLAKWAEADLDKLVRAQTGIANLYNPYRPRVPRWADKNIKEIRSIFRATHNGVEPRLLIKQLEKLPAVPRGSGGALPAHKLLTPVLACLAPGKRLPIINGHRGVTKLLGLRGVRTSSVLTQYDALRPLFEQFGISSAFELDVWSWRADERIQPYEKPKTVVRKKRGVSSASTQPLGLKDASDVNAITTLGSVVHTQIHNEMTNCLRTLARSAGLRIDEATGKRGRFDCLVYGYAGDHRDLLIEVKSSTDRAAVRLAIGQLLDYRRSAPNRHQTDLAVLLPGRPDTDTRALLEGIAIKPMWFDRKWTRTHGALELG